MWSQEDVFNTQELEDWIKRASKVNTNLEFFVNQNLMVHHLILFMKMDFKTSYHKR